MAFGVTGTFQRARQALRDDKGHILGMRPRTPQEVLAFILENSVRDRKTGCLLCNLRPDEKGYARVRYGKEVRAHTVIFFKGIMPPARQGPQVLHTCDRRNCVEENHLYAGTNKQNIADKVSRDRSGKKLNIAKVRRIKAMLRQGHKHKYIAQWFGISPTTVHYIKSGRHWAHVQNAKRPGSVVDSPTESGA